MLDSFNRDINYIRISVTEKCNLRCIYCVPEDFIPHETEDSLLIHEIIKVVESGVSMGISKVRITGGEPLVRNDIVEIVSSISQIEGVREVAITTNGILLKAYAKKLKEAGLNRVNVSLDAVDEEEYKKITRGGDVNRVFEGINAALACELLPIKLNCVIEKTNQESNAQAVMRYAREQGLELRFIHQMDLVKGTFEQVEGGNGGDCKQCNRIRLTSCGDVIPCLFNTKKYNIREEGIDTALKRSIQNKPKSGTNNINQNFYHIGG